MATFILSASPAKPSGSGFSVVMYLDGTPDPMPDRRFDANTVDEVKQNLAAFLAEAHAKAEPMAVCVRLDKGRAPNGFKTWKASQPFYHRVNV